LEEEILAYADLEYKYITYWGLTIKMKG
jgi:hypothetical protein